MGYRVKTYSFEKSTKPKKVLPLDTASKSSLRNRSKFHIKPRKVWQKKTKLVSFYDEPCRFLTNLRGLVFSYKTFLDFIWNLERFRSEGFPTVPRGRTFLGFVDFLYCFFRHCNSSGSYLTSSEPFWMVQEKTVFQRVDTVSFS